MSPDPPPDALDDELDEEPDEGEDDDELPELHAASKPAAVRSTAGPSSARMALVVAPIELNPFNRTADERVLGCCDVVSGGLGARSHGAEKTGGLVQQGACLRHENTGEEKCADHYAIGLLIETGEQQGTLEQREGRHGEYHAWD